ncbi:Dzip1l [Scenedesmus sp. PABB004]|nr:Dzip1l [Scenedesmus sp. PABB004]
MDGALGPAPGLPHRRRDVGLAGGGRDQAGAGGGEGGATYAPFKFEARRQRIDWRLLTGVDVNRLVRDTDLDALERLVPSITWGDIEAEDTRHLGEAGFVKAFRLAQLLLEYLLYVQDSLTSANAALEAARARALATAAELAGRARQQAGELKAAKRELRRARKTARTLELMATVVGAGGPGATAAAAAAAAAAAVQSAAPAQPPAPPLAAAQQPPWGAEQQAQLGELAQRLAAAGREVAALRVEREELAYTVRHLHDTLAARTDGPRSAQRHFSPGRSLPGSPGGGDWPAGPGRGAANERPASPAQQAAVAALRAELAELQGQLGALRTENLGLRQQLGDAAGTDAAAAADATAAAVRAQLDDRLRELIQLQAELRQRDSSLAVFKQSEEALRGQLEALQRTLNSPEAATPSFVAGQRQRLAAAEAGAARAADEAVALRAENLDLSRQLGALRAQSARGGGGGGDEDAVAAAEALLAGTPAAAHGGDGGASGGGEGGSSSAWKLREIERLQGENRQLSAKAASLQERLHELERLNQQLDREAARARRLGLAASLEAGGGSAGSSPRLGGWATGSVTSSGPHQELTAADLAAGEPDGAAAGNDPDGFSDDGEEGGVAAGARPVVIAVKPAAAQPPLKRVLFDGAPDLDGAAPPADAIPAFRPAAAAAGEPPGDARGPAGAISQAAAATLRGLTAELAAALGGADAPRDGPAAEAYGEAVADWDKPFDLSPEEKAEFRALLPHDVPGRPGVLCARPRRAEELAARRGGVLAGLNRRLDAALASYGIHPGRPGLSRPEFMAAMQMLSERRAAWAAALDAGAQERVEVARLGLLLHTYTASQEVLAAQPEGPDGKRRLPGPPPAPALASAVRPPASMLPTGPPAVRVAGGGGGGAVRPAGPLAASFSAPHATSTRYAQPAAAAASDSEDGGSPTHHARAGGRAGPRGAAPAAGSARASPGASPRQHGGGADALAAAVSAGGAFSPLAAALHAKRSASPTGASSRADSLSPGPSASRLGPGGGSAQPATAGPQPRSAPAAGRAGAGARGAGGAAALQNLGASFDESDFF